MRIVVEFEDGKKPTIFNDVTDAYIAVRQIITRLDQDGKNPIQYAETTSRSWGSFTRDLIKEVTQSLVELQDYLRGLRDGNRG